MLTKRSLSLVLVGGVSQLASVGVADAEPGEPPPADTAASVARQVTLSPAEQSAQAEAAIARLDTARNGVRRQLENARTQRDVVKVLCLNDKLNQIDVTLRSARERKQALDAAIQRKDVDLATHEHTILSVLRQRGEQLTAEANQCIGGDPLFVDDSEVRVEVDDPNREDPSEYPSAETVIEVPACSSCFK